jgi:hypothetical protein
MKHSPVVQLLQPQRPTSNSHSASAHHNLNSETTLNGNVCCCCCCFFFCIQLPEGCSSCRSVFVFSHYILVSMLHRYAASVDVLQAALNSLLLLVEHWMDGWMNRSINSNKGDEFIYSLNWIVVHRLSCIVFLKRTIEISRLNALDLPRCIASSWWCSMRSSIAVQQLVSCLIALDSQCGSRSLNTLLPATRISLRQLCPNPFHDSVSRYGSDQS